MAEAQRARHHVHETNALSYGHFGTATYDERIHGWSFLRQHERQRDSDANEGHAPRHAAIHFQPVGERILNLQADASSPNNATRSHTANATGLPNLFLNNIPDAAFVGTSPQTSAYNLELSQGYPAQTRSLANTLALGYARPPFESGMHNNAPAIAIVAMPAGPNYDTLRLLGFEARQVEIRNDAGLDEFYPLPYVGNTAFGQWCESADAILQVSSAPHKKGTHFLVVKSSGTTILRPRVGDIVPGVLAPTKPAARSTPKHRLLDACPAAKIPASRTGGSPHAHAAFNPDDHNMVAIVDISGQWSTWKLMGSAARSGRILYQVHLQGSNNLHLKDQYSSSKSGTLQGDEWHQISWLASPEGDMDRVLVCNRRVAAVYGQIGELSGHVDMRLGPPSDRNVILDVKNSIRRRDHLFVLTTSRLLIFSSTEGSWKERNPIEPLELVSSWNHFRDRADLSLRMSIIESPKDSWILIFSRSDSFALMYRFGYESSNSSVVSLEDPSIFQLPQGLKDQMGHISDIVLCPVKLSTQSRPFDVVDHALIKLIACTNDGLIIEALYKHTLLQTQPAEGESEPAGGESQSTAGESEPAEGESEPAEEQSDDAGEQSEPARKKFDRFPVLSLPRLSNRFPLSAKYIDEDDLDDFVVSKTTAGEHFPEKRNAVSNPPKETRPATLNLRSWERVLEDLTLKDGEVEEMSWRATLQQAVEQFENLQAQNRAMSVQLVSDLVNDCSIMDLEADSQDLGSWLDDLAVRPDVRPEAVSFPRAQTDSAHHQLLNHYNKLADAFVQPLSDRLTDRNRVNRERLVRQIAGPAVFGSLMLRTKQALGHSEPPPLNPAPIPESKISYPSPAPDSDDPEPSQSPAPEVSVASEEPAVTRLRQYVAFRHQVPPLLLDHIAGTSVILGHLPASIQEDPIEYSYQQTNQRMKLVQEQHAAESLDPKQRKKALKSAARLQRKLERNQLMGQEAVLQSTSLPSIGTSRGVAALPGRDVQSSQAAVPGSSQTNNQDQTALPGLTMTQPERGAFGTRQAAKKVNKKRRAGF